MRVNLRETYFQGNISLQPVPAKPKKKTTQYAGKRLSDEECDALARAIAEELAEENQLDVLEPVPEKKGKGKGKGKGKKGKR